MNFRKIALFGGSLVLAGAVGFGLKSVLADGIPDANPLYYSGTLTEGGQLVNGTRAIAIYLWPDAASNTSLCQTTATTTPVINGRFRIALASSCKQAINANPSAYVEVLDNGTSLGRSPVGAVPYAVEADHAVNATTAATANAAGGALATALGGLAAKTSIPLITAWTAYSPTVTAGGTDISATESTSAWWRRVGDTIEVKLVTSFASCAQGGALLWSLPSGVVPDSAKIASSEAMGGGLAYGPAAGNTVLPLVVTGQGATGSVGVDVTGASGGGAMCSSVGATGSFRMWFHSPVQGWTVTGP